MRKFLAIVLLGMALPALAGAAEVNRVTYCEQLHPPSEGEGAAAQFSAYTFTVEQDSVIFYGFSFSDQSLVRINAETRVMSTLAVPENLIAHDMVASEGKLYILQDRETLEHRDRFMVYERSPSGDFSTHHVRQGLSTLSLGHGEQPVVGGASLGIDTDGTVFVRDMHDGRFVKVVVSGMSVALENQVIETPAQDNGTDRSIGTLQLRTRLEETETYLDYWVFLPGKSSRSSGLPEGSFKIPKSDLTYATEGRAFHPVLRGTAIEFWSATRDMKGVTFHKYPIGG